MQTKKSDEKKRDIGKATIDLISNEGLDTISFRRIADASGYSLGSVQNFFKNLRNLYIFTMKTIVELGKLRAEKLQLFSEKIDLEEFLRFSEQLLPLDEQRRNELVAWETFLSKSNTDFEIKKVAAELLTSNYIIMEQIFDLMKAKNIFKPNLETTEAVKVYYSFLEGISQHSLILDDRYSVETIKGMVKNFVTANYL